MKKITVFTIVYNGYGHFIPQWLEYLDKQTIEIDKFIVLGERHGADLDFLDKKGIRYVLSEEKANMGALRNEGLKHIKTEWWLYFAVDDELLPHACEEIINTKSDVVSLSFNKVEEDGEITYNQHSPCFVLEEDLRNWKSMWGGYTAVKGNTDLRYREDIEVPNITFHLDMFKRQLLVARSKSICVIHHRWNNSHHFRSSKDGSRKKMVQLIDKEVEQIIIDYKGLLEKRRKGMEELKEKKVVVKIIQGYDDKVLNRHVDNEEIIVDPERAEVLIKGGVAIKVKEIETLNEDLVRNKIEGLEKKIKELTTKKTEETKKITIKEKTKK